MDPESSGFSRPTYGSIRIKRIPFQRNSRLDNSPKHPRDLKQLNFDGERAAFAFKTQEFHDGYPSEVGGLLNSRNQLGSHVNGGPATAYFTEDIKIAQRELMKTHQEILALEEEIRKSRIR